LQAGDNENGNGGKSRLTQFMHATLQLLTSVFECLCELFVDVFVACQIDIFIVLSSPARD